MRVFDNPPTVLDMRRRAVVLSLWIALMSVAVCFYFFRPGSLHELLARLSGAPLVWLGAFYLLLGRQALAWIG